MSDVVAKYARFVNLLLEKTRSSRIPWSYTHSKSTIFVWNDDVLLNIVKSQDENFEDTYTVQLLNKSGVHLENFDDATLTNAVDSFSFESYYDKLRNLYDLGMRQATGADKALDAFISAVEADELDIPF